MWDAGRHWRKASKGKRGKRRKPLFKEAFQPMQRLTLPLEIYGMITDNVDNYSNETLLALTLTSHRLKREADRRLYRKVDISLASNKPSVPILLDMFERLMASPNLLQHVRELHLRDPLGVHSSPSDFLSVNRLVQAFTSLPNPLRHATQLKTIYLHISDLCKPSVLAAISDSVQLHTFSYAGEFGGRFVMDRLTTFLSTQKEIQMFGIHLKNLSIMGSKQPLGCQIPSIKTLVAKSTCLHLVLPQPSLIGVRIISPNVPWPSQAEFPSLAGIKVLRLDRPPLVYLPHCSSCFPTLQLLEIRGVRPNTDYATS